jgi:hypothetical protein
MIIRLFIFNAFIWGLKYINLPIQIELHSLILENNLWPRFLEQIGRGKSSCFQKEVLAPSHS